MSPIVNHLVTDNSMKQDVVKNECLSRNFKNNVIKTHYIAASFKTNYTFNLFGEVFPPNFQKYYKVTLELIFLLENVWTFK